MALLEEFAHQREIDVVRSSIAERRVVLSGTIAQLTKAFPVKLQKAVFKGKTLRVRTGSVGVPAELAKIVEDVKGFDNRPQARPHFRRSANGVVHAPARRGLSRRLKSGSSIIFPQS
jgi:kumamolisin